MTTARELARRLRRREISAEEVFREHVQAIERENPKWNAIVTLTLDQAHQAALRADAAAARGEFFGPLHGIPVGHKDLQETRGVRTTFGSPLHAEYVPDFDTEIVRRIQAAGALPMGKTNTPEFGAGSQTFNPIFGATRNPHDGARTCGGSSGGAAVALATGMISLADGSDTGGSLRNPASFCGVTGLRPTPGRVPIVPNRCPDSPLTVNGPMARNSGDAALLFSVMTGDPEPELERDFRGVRVGWLSEIDGMPFEPAVLDTAKAARQRLESIGCRVADVTLDFRGADEAFRILRAREFHALHGDKPVERMKETVQQEIRRGAVLSGEEIRRALSLREEVRGRAFALLAKWEFLALPTVQVLPFPIEQPYVTEINGIPMDTYIDWMRSCYYISILGIPALSTPAGTAPGGLPVGLQLAGRENADWDVLGLGHALETAAASGYDESRRP